MWPSRTHWATAGNSLAAAHIGGAALLRGVTAPAPHPARRTQRQRQAMEEKQEERKKSQELALQQLRAGVCGDPRRGSRFAHIPHLVASRRTGGMPRQV